MTFAGILLVMGMRATLFTHMLAASSGKGHAFGGNGTGSAITVGFSNDLISHENLSKVQVTPVIVTHSNGLFLTTHTASPRPPERRGVR